MKKKKNIIKTIKILFIGLLGILLLWILINRFDIPEIKTEYDGKTAIDYFGKPDYGTVTVILKDNQVVQCVYGAWDDGDMDWADDFHWQEKPK